MQRLLLIICLFLGLSAGAQNTQLTATVSKNKIAAGQQFQVTFSLNSSGSSFRPPKFDDFIVLSGPNQSTNMQFVNGKMSSNMSYSYVLSATGTGKYTIGAASIRANGKTYESKPIQMEVVKGAAPRQQQGRQQAQPNQPQQRDMSDDLFARLSVNKNAVYQGEQLVATYKIYWRVNIVDNSMGDLPSFTGFWAEDIEIPPASQIQTEVIKGVRYSTAVLKKVVLFPQSSGELELPSMSLNVVVRVQSGQRRRSLFDQVFGTYKDMKYEVRSNTAKISVKPLPNSGRPENFAGSVGTYSLKANVNKETVKANEAINLNIVLTGKGNLKLLEKPNIEFPPDFEVYDPKIKDNITTNANGVSGSRTFEYLIIPRHAGEFQLDAIEFPYFDPKQKKYLTLRSDDFNISVTKGDEESSSSYSSVNKEDLKFIGKDIRFIKTGPAFLSEKGWFFFGSFLFFVLLLIPPAAFILVLLLRKKYADYSSDTAGLKRRQASKVATKRLKKAESFMKQNETNAFYEEVFRAVYGYLGDRLNISASELNKDNISEQLTTRKVPPTTIASLINILDRCEMARFAPVNDISPQQVYNETATVIGTIEKELK